MLLIITIGIIIFLDIDECSVYAGRSIQLCQGICQNTPGSYTCTCPPGYQLSPDHITCRGTIHSLALSYLTYFTFIFFFIFIFFR